MVLISTTRGLRLQLRLFKPLDHSLSKSLYLPKRRLISTNINNAPLENPSEPVRSSGKWSKWSKRLQWAVVGGIVVYTVDKYANASALTRNLRSVYNLTFIGLDYKLNFEKGKDIEALHRRSSERLYNLLVANQGLYIKMGQAVAIQEGIFPEKFREKFGKLFDAAPQDSWATVEKTIKSELKLQDIAEIFDKIDRRAVASASIAQVHKARLRHNGEWVAVKVQHDALSKQVKWDLACYKGMMWFFETFMFDLPISFVANYVSEQLENETDFRKEAENSALMASFVQNDPKLQSKAYIPKVYENYTTKRVLITEWIDGVPLSNTNSVLKQRFNAGKALQTIYDLYSKQIFLWGLVHCDPHPGNIILRRDAKTKQEQVVLLDHGLVIREAPAFKRQYAQLWQGMFMLDQKKIFGVAKEWGFGDGELLASSVMMKMYKSGGEAATTRESLESKQEKFEITFEEEDEYRKRFQNFLKDTKKIPLELIFIGRTMRILQGLNKRFGSPINRIKIFGHSASKAINAHHDNTIRGRLKSGFNESVFRFTILLTDLLHWVSRAYYILVGKTLDFDDQLDV